MQFIIQVGVTFFLLLRMNDLDRKPPVAMGKFETIADCIDMAKQNLRKEQDVTGIRYQCIEITPTKIEAKDDPKIDL